MIHDFLQRDSYAQKHFLELQKKFVASVNSRTSHSGKYGFLHSLPFVFDRGDDQSFSRLYGILAKSMRYVIENYFNDPEIFETIVLPEKAKSLIRECGDLRLGTFRPDFLIDENGNYKINEINARFPFNGFFISHYLNEGLNQISPEVGVSSNHSLEDIFSKFSRMSGRIFVAKRLERDWDISFFREEVPNTDFVFPEMLEDLVDDCDSVVLELQQGEILRSFNSGLVSKLNSKSHLNDLRTILIGHDKRLLALLCDRNFVLKYLSKDDVDFLQPYLIETYAMNNVADLGFVEAEKDEWVLKSALKGKGKDVYLGVNLSLEEWKKVCEKALNEPFVLQRKVDEKNFKIYIPYLGEVDSNISGMLLGIDSDYISVGCCRGTFEDPTTISDGVFSTPSTFKN
jgi:hypothetical protein